MLSLVKVLTLNAAGIPLALGLLGPRIESLAALVRERAPDVAAFQEVWLERDARRLRELAGLPYAARASGPGLVGNGLLVLSRYPVVSARFVAFRARPAWVSPESLSRKGALLVRLKTPWGERTVLDVHLATDYGRARARTTRREQLLEVAALAAAEGAHAVLGDFNEEPELVREALEPIGLKDACAGPARPPCGVTVEGLRADQVWGRRAAASALLPADSDHAAFEARLDLR